MGDSYVEAPMGGEPPAPPIGGPRQTPNVAGGLLLGLLAAIAGAVGWYLVVTLTEYQIGYLAIAVGALIGYAVKLGAGRIGSRVLQAISVALTAVAMIAAEYFVARAFAAQLLAGDGVRDIPLLLPPADAIAVVQSSVTADPLTLAFWAVALATAWRLPAASASE